MSDREFVQIPEPPREGWIVGPRNSNLDRGSYYLSYCPVTGCDPLFRMIDDFLGIPHQSETAICVRGRDGHTYVLVGDHRAALEKCSTLPECVAYFVAHRDQWGQITDTPEGVSDDN